MASPFYARSLEFSCVRCSACCRHEPGYVFLRESDVNIMAKTLKMRYSGFMETYCRWIPSGNGSERLSLKEKKNFDCIFWEDGCRVYESRPLQCRSFPFWPSILASAETWKANAAYCPGMKGGALHLRGTIESWLEQQRKEPVITKGGC